MGSEPSYARHEMEKVLTQAEIRQRMVTQLMTKSMKQLEKTKTLLDDLDQTLDHTSKLLESNRRILLQIEHSRAKLRSAFNKLVSMTDPS